MRRLGHHVGLQPRNARVIKLVAHGIHFLAHGIGNDAQPATHAGTPGAPGDRIERGDSVQRNSQAAGDSLGSRHADAHAGERPGAAAHGDGIDITRHEPGFLEQEGGPCEQDLVGLPRRIDLT